MPESLAFPSHPKEDTLELYCLGRLDEEESAPVEEHLLTCSDCQIAVTELDFFLKAAKQAAREVRQEDRYREPAQRFAWFGKPAWVAAGTLAAALLIAVPLLKTSPATANVDLAAFRGGVLDGSGTAAAGKPLNLRVDLKGIPSADCCLIELVDSTGKVVSQGQSAPEREQALYSVPGLTAGRYWVRVKAKSGELLRETGLEIR